MNVGHRSLRFAQIGLRDLGHAVRASPLVVLGTTAALLGSGLALIRPDLLPQPSKAEIDPIAWLVPEQPLQPPPLDQIASYQPDQVLPLDRADGSVVSVGYSSMILDPRWVDLEFFGGWQRELEANNDSAALLFFTGPTFEKGHPNKPLGIALHGDLKLRNGLWLAGNRAAAAGRAYVAASESGDLVFGYGDLTAERQARYRWFIGGLHAFDHTVTPPPESYRGVYGAMKLADVRIVYGLRADGRLEVIETADGVHFDDLRLLVKALGFQAAYLPDHASKSRLIVPGRRLWSKEQAVWVSGGKPSITALPFMLRVVPRSGPA